MGEDIFKDLGGTLYLRNDGTGGYEPLLRNFTFPATTNSCKLTAEGILKQTNKLKEITERKTMFDRCKWNFYVEKVIYNKPATIVFFTDGSKTVVKAKEGDPFDPEKGLALAIIKRSFNNDSASFHKFLRTWRNGTEDDEVVDLIVENQLLKIENNEFKEKIKKGTTKKK